jgi:hypothetical protein
MGWIAGLLVQTKSDHLSITRISDSKTLAYQITETQPAAQNKMRLPKTQ